MTARLEDSALVRKARGAFFTPPAIADFLTRWAIRSPDARVMDPTCGEAVFLRAAAERLRRLKATPEAIAEHRRSRRSWLWLSGRDDILSWWVGQGAGCRGSRVIATSAANGSPAFGQYKSSDTGQGYDPWALQVLEVEQGRIVEFTFFLGTETIFPLFGLPARPVT